MYEIYMGWPQWAFLALQALGVLGTLSSWDRTSEDGIWAVFGAILVLWILYMGGFWTAGR